MNNQYYIQEAIELLRQLIATPRVSRDETAAADIMEQWMRDRDLIPQRVGNNLLLVCPDYDPARKTIMLNAHIDTVKPVASYTRDPHEPTIEGDVLYGIGSNDCGGGLVTLLQVYRILTQQQAANSQRPYNLIYLASCEEEVSGTGGIRKVIPELPRLIPGFPNEQIISNDSSPRGGREGASPRGGMEGASPRGGMEGAFPGGWEGTLCIVGEPTSMQPAVAEKGLMVIDMTAHGKSGHAARNEGVNAIYEALDDMVWVRDYKFEKVSDFLGPTRMTLTVINAGTQHNVIPDECRMILDIRSNEHYTNEEIFEIIRQHVHSDIKARSFHLRSSHISTNNPLIQRLVSMGKKPFGSPTLSDQALMPWQSFKLGPGDSSRSHSADEFIRISELEDALDTYLKLLS